MEKDKTIVEPTPPETLEIQDIEYDSTGRQLELRLMCPKHRFISKVMKRRNGVYSLMCGCDREKVVPTGTMQPPMLSYPERS